MTLYEITNTCWRWLGRLKLFRFTIVITLTSLALIMAGCATPLPTVPPIGTEGVSHPGKVVWHDLVTPDLKRAKTFYGGLLGWTFEDVSNGYTLARNNGELVAGIAKLNTSGQPGHWVPLMSVSDMDAVLSHTTGSGGSIVLKPFNLPGRGKVALVRDPQGAAFGVVESREGDPEDRGRIENEWLWDEVWIEDVPAAIKYYQGIADFEVDEKAIFDNPYRFLSRDGQPRFGFLEKSRDDIESTWVSYILVADVEAAVAQTEVLGGKVLLAPHPDVRNGTVAIVTDPDGAGFILQESEQ